MRPLIRKLGRHERRLIGSARLYRFRRNGSRPELRLLVTGDGAGRARDGIAAFFRLAPNLGADRCLAMVVIGVSGGVTPDLAVGDLVVADRVALDRSAEESTIGAGFESSAAASWTRHLTAGLVVTVSRLADTVSAKETLRRRWREVYKGPILVDMESYWYVAAANSRRIPWAVVRAVSDTSHESLPGYLDACRDTDGASNRIKVLLRALVNPVSLPALIRLGRRVGRGAVGLERSVMELVSQGARLGLEQPGDRCDA